jgi:protease IV
MTRLVKTALAAATLVAAAPAAAQISAAVDRSGGAAEGIALPIAGVAAAEEPTGLAVNPASVRFVEDLALVYFHEGNATPDSAADGVYAATSWGPLGVGLSEEWMRPGEANAHRYRRTKLALAVGDGRTASLGVGWTWTDSPDATLGALDSWDLGLTWRPWRHLSVAAAMLGRDAGAGVPSRYDFGLATRFWNDGATLAVDLLADDRGRDDFHATHVAFGAAAETHVGLALALQVQVPIASGLSGAASEVAAVVSLSWNAPFSGFTGGATQVKDQTGWLTGVRVSSERYRAAAIGGDAPSIDLDEALQRRRTLIFDLGERDPYGALAQRLEQARQDPEVTGLVVRIDGVSLGAGRVEELRTLLAAIAAKKPVLAYLRGGTTRDYWLATAATVVAAPPGAPLFVNGASSSQLYLKEALARLGVGFEVVKAGAYKSAAEPLVRTEASPEAREATEAVLDDQFGRVVRDVAAARRLPPEKVRALVDQGLFRAEEAKEAGLLDEVLWPDELETALRRAAGHGMRVKGDYRPTSPRNAQRWGRPPVVEVVRLDGVIAQGKSRDPFGADAIAGAETVGAAIARAARDGSVSAIVLRIESPGGDGLASDLIWREVVRARRKKPVVASMGDYAASGGYLVAAGCDAIVAGPSTLTGSIGVFVLKPDLSGLLGKLSIRREAYTRGQNAQLTSLLRPWSEPERAVLEKQISAFYGLFLDRVAEGRKLSRAEVEAVAGGRVWTGQQALQRRLVDRVGTLEDAVAIARERAGLAADEDVEVRRTDDGDRGPVLRAVGGVASALLPSEPPLARLLSSSPELSALLTLSELGPVLALPEEWIPSP